MITGSELPAMLSPAGRNLGRASGTAMELSPCGERTRRGGGNRRVRCRSRPGPELWRALTRTKSELLGESPSDSPQSATEAGRTKK